MFRDEPDEYEDDDTPMEPISGIVDRLKQYSRNPEPEAQPEPAPDDAETPQT